MSDFYEYMSDPSHDDQEESFDDMLLPGGWVTPDDERYVSSFDTVEEDRGER